jgi:hypothetical protein
LIIFLININCLRNSKKGDKYRELFWLICEISHSIEQTREEAMPYLSNRLRCLTAILFTLSLILDSSAIAQHAINLYIGNIDSSPFSVPSEGIVNLPVYISGPRVGGGQFKLIANRSYVFDLLGGNFYINGEYLFRNPQYFDGYVRQQFLFTPDEWHQGIFHLADFTVMMEADSADIGYQFDALNVSDAQFSDTLGYYLYPDTIHISPLMILGINSISESAKPGNFSLYDAYPNPFNSSTTIRLSIPYPTDIDIKIFNITGRIVRAFKLPDCQAGERSVVWDGRDDRGNYVSSGTYFYRVSGNRFSQSSRVTLIK